MTTASTKYVPGPQRSRVLELRRRGLSGVAIARVLGISHQVVYDHLKELRRRGVLDGKEAS